MSKKIYILQRTDAIGYDEYDAKIVRANSARKIACRGAGGDGAIWLNAAHVTCKVVGLRIELRTETKKP